MPIYALGDVVPTIHPTAYVHPDAVIIGNVTLEEEANIWPGAVLRGDYGRITIGARSSVQDGTIIHSDGPTTIGADCIIGHNAHLHDCTVEDLSLIASMSVVLQGAVIRTGALVGAGALVPNGMEVPSGAMALGVPAKLRLDSANTEWTRLAVEAYRFNANRYRTELRRIDSA